MAVAVTNGRGRPLGAADPVFTLDLVGANQYATSYRPSSLVFPRAGCGEVIAKTTTSELKFVTYVEQTKAAARNP